MNYAKRQIMSDSNLRQINDYRLVVWRKHIKHYAGINIFIALNNTTKEFTEKKDWCNSCPIVNMKFAKSVGISFKQLSKIQKNNLKS